MSTLLLRLAGPMQSWGNASRFTRRETAPLPTKSGVVGLLAAAAGRRRTDSIEDLLSLRFGVRVDQQGVLGKDFQTAQRWDTGERMPLSQRFYLNDAVFVAAVEGDDALITSLRDHVDRPRFPLYLGRRSYPPSRQVCLGVKETGLNEALHAYPWQASDWYRRRQPMQVRLHIVRDADPRDEIAGTARDVPLSFDPERRQYGWRNVAHDFLVLDNPLGRETPPGWDDYFDAVSSA